MGNLYVHFPFCRRKCTYCALYSLTTASAEDRNRYVANLAKALPQQLERFKISPDSIKTVYFGGGSPAWCELQPIFAALKNLGVCPQEFTVELHPQDVREPTLECLRAGGVNRISMGVQSLDDATLAKMGRGYRLTDAAAAFRLICRYFDNVGIDLILGYPGDPTDSWDILSDWGLKHCSVYSLILEPSSRLYRQLGDRPQGFNQECGVRPQGFCLPSDDEVLDRIAECSRFLAKIGLKRYEISNYAVPGYECQHNLAVWRGEDYLGLGAGAFGRIGRLRLENVGLPSGQNTQGLTPENTRGLTPACGKTRGLTPMPGERVETVTEAADRMERVLFRLRTREGLEPSDFPEWVPVLEKYVAEGLLKKIDCAYRLTARGTEVCDSILADLV